MAYIGRGTENISNVEVLDNLTFNGSASYTLQKSSVNFVPSSANNLLISISGVVQQGNFTVSGSTITFDTTVASSDTCDWILHYGTGLITTVADGAITEAKLGNNAVTASKIDSSVALGKIGQVVNSNYFTNTQTTSSKILITHSAPSNVELSNTTNLGHIAIFRDSTNITTSGHNSSFATYKTLSRGYGSGITVLDSPSSTSAISYSVRGKTDNTGLTFYYGSSGQPRMMSLTLMEVLA